VRPRIAVPVHGEMRHIAAHVELAKACQVPEAIEPSNGQVIRLAPGPAAVVATVRSGRLALDGTTVRALDSPVLRDRHRLMYNGSAVATVVLTEKGALAATPSISARGLLDPDTEQAELRLISDAVSAAIEQLSKADRKDDAAVEEAARRAVRREIKSLLGHKPVTDIHVVRI